MLKYELGLFYIKIKMHLKILLVSTKQVITGQVIKIKFTQKSNFGGWEAKKSLDPIRVS